MRDVAPSRRDRTFFRVVKQYTPTDRDFYSQQALKPRAPRPLGVSERSWRSVSVFEDIEAARRTALRAPLLGAYIARLDVPAGTRRVRMQHTPKVDEPSHWDLLARPSVLRRLVVSVTRVEPRRRLPASGVQ